MEFVRTAGGLLWRAGRAPRLAVIHRPRQDDWTLPKGKVAAGEGWLAAALREVHEETGCTARLAGFAGATCYEVRRGLKIVLYWNMEVAREGPLERLDEVDEVRWLTPDDALERLDHPRERKLVERAVARRSRCSDARRLIEHAEAAISRGDVEHARRVVAAARALA